MLVRSRIFGVVAVLAAIVWVAPAFATAIPVGTGASHAEVYVEFQDSAIFTFDVAFSGLANGIGLFDIIQAEQSLTTDRQNFGWGEFVNGIAFQGHDNSGYGGGENWWHYWTREAGGDWASPPYGAADRVVVDDVADGWIYGRAGAPMPEPVTAGLLIAGAVLVLGGRRSKLSR